MRNPAPVMPRERHRPQICMFHVSQIAAVRLCYSNRLRQIDTVACVSYAIVFLLITFVAILLCTHWQCNQHDLCLDGTCLEVSTSSCLCKDATQSARLLCARTLNMQTRDSDVVVETARLNTIIRTERCRLHALTSWASSYH